METHEHIHSPSDVPPGGGGEGMRGRERAKKETVRDAAILYKGEMFTGTTHGHALGELQKKHPDFLYDDIEESDGFVTTSGRFIKRDEALRLARLGRQLQPGSDKHGKTELTSEDLK